MNLLYNILVKEMHFICCRSIQYQLFCKTDSKQFHLSYFCEVLSNPGDYLNIQGIYMMLIK